MITTILILIIISVFSLVMVDEFEPLLYLKDKIGLGSKRKLKSKYLFIDSIIYTIWKIMNCAPCFSYHSTWIIFLILGSNWGFIFGFLTYLITKYLYLKLWGVTSF